MKYREPRWRVKHAVRRASNHQDLSRGGPESRNRVPVHERRRPRRGACIALSGERTGQQHQFFRLSTPPVWSIRQPGIAKRSRSDKCERPPARDRSREKTCFTPSITVAEPKGFSNRRICPNAGREVGSSNISIPGEEGAPDHEGKDSHDNASGGNNRTRFVRWSRGGQVGQRVMLGDRREHHEDKR